MTDKVFYLTTFPTLVYLADRVGQHGHARVLLVLAILFLLRDQWVSFLRSLGALHNLSAKANWSGKARTLISFPTICVIYYYLQAPAALGLRVPDYLVYGLKVLSMVINFISIGVYTLRFWPALGPNCGCRMKRNRIQGDPTADSAATEKDGTENRPGSQRVHAKRRGIAVNRHPAALRLRIGTVRGPVAPARRVRAEPAKVKFWP